MKVTVYLTIITTDVDRNGTSVHGESWTQDAQPPLIHHEHQDEEETPHPPSTSKKDDSSCLHELVKAFQGQGETLFRHWTHLLSPYSNFINLESLRSQISLQFFRSWKKNINLLCYPKGQIVEKVDPSCSFCVPKA